MLRGQYKTTQKVKRLVDCRILTFRVMALRQSETSSDERPEPETLEFFITNLAVYQPFNFLCQPPRPLRKARCGVTNLDVRGVL